MGKHKHSLEKASSSNHSSKYQGSGTHVPVAGQSSASIRKASKATGGYAKGKIRHAGKANQRESVAGFAETAPSSASSTSSTSSSVPSSSSAAVGRASGSSATKHNLSSNLMKMKFMQRRQEADLRKKLEQEQKKIADASHWTAPREFVDQHMKRSSAGPELQVEVDDSYLGFEELNSIGRKSYQNFNALVEKLAKEPKRHAAASDDKEWDERKTVSDAEMAKVYSANTSQ